MNRKFIALALLLVSACSNDDQPQHHRGRPIDKWPEGAVLLLDDHQGSVVAEVDAYGRPVANTAYHPYGTTRASSGSPSPFGYVNNERDVGSGLGDFHKRPYRYDTGTFLSVDPQALFPRANSALTDAALDPYAYSKGNPVVLSDPNGDCPICVAIGIGLIAGMWTASPANAPQTEKTHLYSPTPLWETGAVAGMYAAAPMLARTIGSAGTGAAMGVGGVGIEDIANGKVSSPGTYLKAALLGGLLGKGADLVVNAPGRISAWVSRLESVDEAPALYRQGTFSDPSKGWEGNYVKGKQWATDNPLTTADYAQKYGLPACNAQPDWVVKGRIDGPYSTQPAGPSWDNPANTGGATEVVPKNPDSVRLEWFHMPDKD
jgi:RHS repeat-associated protein